mmetsp:Transcript_58938/g.144172  ORF Transcript_58938/g.144172 Transcript_58938/m.144172 type:complete len:83 (+) Transcript_58938:1132-1380(+)
MNTYLHDFIDRTLNQKRNRRVVQLCGRLSIDEREIERGWIGMFCNEVAKSSSKQERCDLIIRILIELNFVLVHLLHAPVHVC